MGNCHDASHSRTCDCDRDRDRDRRPSRTSRRRSPSPYLEKHHALKTSLQVIGMLICLRVLIPQMFPSEEQPSPNSSRPRDRYRGQDRGHGQGYTQESGYAYTVSEPDNDQDDLPPRYEEHEKGYQRRRIANVSASANVNTAGNAAGTASERGGPTAYAGSEVDLGEEDHDRGEDARAARRARRREEGGGRSRRGGGKES